MIEHKPTPKEKRVAALTNFVTNFEVLALLVLIIAAVVYGYIE